MKIEKLILLMILGIALFTSCNNEPSAESESIIGIQNVKYISGGLVGIEDDYETGIIAWAFNNQTLIVENNDTQGNIYSGFKSGTYNYSATTINGINYIIVDNSEYGGFTLSNNNLIINQNETTYGPGSDGFILQLER